MKRPEGFDRRAAPPPPPDSARAGGGGRAAVQDRGRDRVEQVSEADRDPISAPHDPSSRTASDDRRTRSLLRAAERSRRRAERAEARRFTRRSRRRRVTAIVTSVVVAGLAGLVVLAVFSPILALRVIRVEGTVRLDPAQLERAVDGQIGTPLALVDEDRMTRDLAGFPLIRNYSTEIVPPETLVVRVVERVPVAVLEDAGAFRLVDPAGVEVERSDVRPPGVPQIELAPSDDAGGEAFRAMAEVLLALPDPLLAQVDTVAARTRDDVTLTLTGGGQRVVWGAAADSQRKAEVLQALLAARGGAAGEYDVSAPGNGVFRAG